MKKTINIVLMILSVIVMLTGLTISYFYRRAGEKQIPFTTGILKMDIVYGPDDVKDWTPGRNNSVNLEWCFKNTGNQPAKLRVMIEGEWSPESLDDITKWEQITGWNKEGDYYLYDRVVYPEEEVNLGFDVWLDIDGVTENLEAYDSAEYKIRLTLEAIQETGMWD